MEIKTTIQRQVAVSFTIEEDGDVFPGALVLREEEYALLSPEALEKLQLAKHEEWKKVRAPVDAKAAAKAAAETERQNIASLRAALDAREAELQSVQG